MIRLFTLLVQLALLVFEYLERQRLVTEAERALLRKLQGRFDEVVERANEAARNVSTDPDDILRDAANRDRWVEHRDDGGTGPGDETKPV